MSILTITEQGFVKEVEQSDVPVLVDFWAPWCGYCTRLSPVIDAVESDYSGKLKVGKVNTDEQPGLAQKFGIMSMPTLMLFKGGKAAAPLVGPGSKAQIDKWLKENGV